MYRNIEAERARLQLSKEEIAKKLGVTTKTYYNWIGEIRPIPSKKLIEMSKMFGTTIDYLLESEKGFKEAAGE